MKRDRTEILLMTALVICTFAQGIATILMIADLGFRF